MRNPQRFEIQGVEMEIRRDIYLDKLISKKHNKLIKVITGIRRCGKSYLLFNLFKNHLESEGVPNDHIIEMAFDLYENIDYKNPKIFFPYVKEQIKDEEMYYVLLDEVQLLEEFEAVLNSLSRMNNVDVYVTGSNAKFLSKDIITEFRGRGDEVHRPHPVRGHGAGQEGKVPDCEHDRLRRSHGQRGPGRFQGRPGRCQRQVRTVRSQVHLGNRLQRSRSCDRNRHP